MGQWFSTFFLKYKSITIIGLDGAGKTALTNFIAYGEVVKTIPTLGLNVHSAQRGNVVMEMIDCCGQTNMRPIWKTVYRTSDAVMFVVDGGDGDRLSEVINELRAYCDDITMCGKPLLVLVNKQDIPNAFDGSSLKEHVYGDCWRVFDVCVKSGEGVHEAMNWLTSVI